MRFSAFIIALSGGILPLISHTFNLEDYLQQIKSDSISGADLSIEASGSGKGIQDAMKLAKWGGKVLFIGIPKNGGSDADFKDMIRGNKDLFTVIRSGQ